MQKKKTHSLLLTVLLATLSVLYTVLVKQVDVEQINPNKSEIGFAELNNSVHNFFSVNMIWYHITDLLGIIPVLTALIFAIVGAVQLIKHKNIFKIDKSIIVLGCFYIIVIAVYIFFESFVINYRPILMNGILEPSYPSSHTLMSICLMYAAITECKILIKSQKINRIIRIISYINVCSTT